MEKDNINISQFIEIIKGGKAVIVTVTLVTVLISAILSFFIITPTYEAQVSVIVAKNNENANTNLKNDDVVMFQNLIKTYAEIAKSNAVAQQTADKLKNEVSMADIEKNITITPQVGTQIMIITAKSNNAELAANMVNTLSQAFIDYAKDVYPAGQIKIVDKADVPKTPVSPKKKLYIAIGFILGLMVSTALVFLTEYMDNTMKTEDDVKRYLDLPVLGMIPNNIEE